MEYKELELDLKMEGEEGIISGYGAVFGNVDGGGDRIIKGAFLDSLGDRHPKMLWNHDTSQPIGRWDEVREDDHGLFVKGKLALGVAKARETYELLKANVIDGLSIGFKTRQSEMKNGVRDVTRIELFEVSPVVFELNRMAKITDVKNDTQITVREIEQVLRTLKGSNGTVSNSAIKAMASGAMERFNDILREAGIEEPEYDQRDVDELKQALINLTKGEMA